MQKLTGIFDGLLVLQYRGGDQKAMALLVKKHHSGLCRHAYWYTRDSEASRDIVQDSWRTIITKIGSLKDPNKFGSWAMTIVTRKSLDYLEKLKRQREQLKVTDRIEAVQDQEENENGDERLRKLKLAMKQLSRDQQAVLRLFYLRGFTLIEIGNILGLSVGTVKSRLFHAREQLKKHLI